MLALQVEAMGGNVMASASREQVPITFKLSERHSVLSAVLPLQ